MRMTSLCGREQCYVNGRDENGIDRRFAEMGFSKIESQHKSQHAKKRQTKNKSHTTPMKIADTLSDLRKAKRSTAQYTDKRSVSSHGACFRFVLKIFSSIRRRRSQNQRKTTSFWHERTSQLNFVKIFFDLTQNIHSTRNRREPRRPTNEYIMVMDVSNNIREIRLNKKLASDLKPSLSVFFFFGESCLEKVSSSNFTP